MKPTNGKSEKLSIKKNYDILEKISEGNFGTVFKAVSKSTGPSAKAPSSFILNRPDLRHQKDIQFSLK